MVHKKRPSSQGQHTEEASNPKKTLKENENQHNNKNIGLDTIKNLRSPVQKPLPVRPRETSEERKKSKITHEENKIEIKLLNVQGLTNAKMYELEKLIKSEQELLCLTETQQKIDKIKMSQNLRKLENMRQEKDRKGGGLMIIWQEGKNIELNKVDTLNKDLLYVRGNIGNTSIAIILVYMSVQDKERNENMETEIRKIIEKLEDENVILLGDFNGHVGYIGDQELNNNGNIVLNIQEQNNLILLNGDDKCEGTYTWNRDYRNQKSVIDYVFTNKPLYGHFINMKIDESQEKIDISDHNLIEIKLRYNRTGGKTFSENKKIVQYYSTKETHLKDFVCKIEEEISKEEVDKLTKLNEIIKEQAEQTLKRTYRRR